ncbi:MAG: methionyl-tRNA formyltransferase [Ktedonobacterales bacterium]
MTTSETEGVPCVVFFGMSGVFSALPLAALLDAGLDVRAVVLPALAGPGSGVDTIRRLAPATAARRRLALLTPATPSTRELAAAHGVAVFEVGDLRAAETLATLAAFEPDAIAVACFPWRLPAEVLRLPRLGCLNVHPSLLPENRGPDPLFWTFRHGDAETGVSIHLMEAALDSGPVLAQERIAVPEGTGEARLERDCAIVGGELLAASVRALAAGTAERTAQDERRATHFGFPSAADYEITPDRPARWAYRFATGVIARGVPVIARIAGHQFRVRGALGYEAEGTLDAPFQLQGDVLALQCAPGIFVARVVPPGDNSDAPPG